MTTLAKLISVYLIGIIELWGAIPAGLAFKLDPTFVALFSAAGASTSAFLVLIIGEPVRKWLLRRKKSKFAATDGKMKHLRDRYGIPGLCLISPFLLGSHLGAAIGLSLGGKKVSIMIWMSISCLIWSILLTAIGTMGISLFHK